MLWRMHSGRMNTITLKLNAFVVNPRTLSAPRLVGGQKRSCARGSQFGMTVVIPSGSCDQQHDEERAFDVGFFIQAPALKYAFKCK